MDTSNAIPPGKDGGNAATYAKVMESITRVALAGFGGAIAGLSISRRRAGALSLARVDAAVSGGSKRRRRRGGSAADFSRQRSQHGGTSAGGSPSAPYVDQDLPSTWAFACLTFAGITESTRLLSPTTLFSDLLEGVNSSFVEDDTSVCNEKKTNAKTLKEGGEKEKEAIAGMSWLSQMPKVDLPASTPTISVEDMRSICDYVIGGSIAGAVFKGSTIQTSAGARWAKRAGSNPSVGITAAATRASFMAGLIPGATLGLLAGILHVGAGHLEKMLEQLDEDNAVDAPTANDGVSEGDDIGTTSDKWRN